MTPDERRHALEQIATEVRACQGCRLAATRTRAVPGEGDTDTEVVFVGEGPGFNEDREGRPFVGRAGRLLVRLLESIGWRRDDVFITNVVKCRPPENRDPQADEIAACAPFLRRQLEVLDPAVVVTLGRYSMATFLPGARIGQVHGTSTVADPETGAQNALVFAMYHPAAALRTPSVERQSFDDIGRVPAVLLRSREQRTAATPASATMVPVMDVARPSTGAETPTVTTVTPGAEPTPGPEPAPARSAPRAPELASVVPSTAMEPPAAPDDAQLTLFQA